MDMSSILKGIADPSAPPTWTLGTPMKACLSNLNGRDPAEVPERCFKALVGTVDYDSLMEQAVDSYAESVLARTRRVVAEEREKARIAKERAEKERVETEKRLEKEREAREEAAREDARREHLALKAKVRAEIEAEREKIVSKAKLDTVVAESRMARGVDKVPLTAFQSTITSDEDTCKLVTDGVGRPGPILRANSDVTTQWRGLTTLAAKGGRVLATVFLTVEAPLTDVEVPVAQVLRAARVDSGLRLAEGKANAKNLYLRTGFGNTAVIAAALAGPTAIAVKVSISVLA